MEAVTVYECVSARDKQRLCKAVSIGREVFVLDKIPLLYKNHAGVPPGFAPPFPPLVDGLLAAGEIGLVRADEVAAGDIGWLALRRGHAGLDLAYPEYRRRLGGMVEAARQALASPDAEDMFRWHFHTQLVMFFAANILLHNVGTRFASRTVEFWPDFSPGWYCFFADIAEGTCGRLAHDNIRFPALTAVRDWLARLKGCCRLALSQSVWVGRAVVGCLRRPEPIANREFLVGVNLASPSFIEKRCYQPDFLVDGTTLRHGDIALITAYVPDAKHLELLGRFADTVITPPTLRQYSLSVRRALRLLFLTLTRGARPTLSELKLLQIMMITHAQWASTLRHVRFRHLVTHCDMLEQARARNIALRQAGVQTWHFADSINLLHLMSPRPEGRLYHPYWSHTLYDHFVTWTRGHAEYLAAHPGGAAQTHVVGHIEITRREGENTQEPGPGNWGAPPEARLVVAAFDSTYGPFGKTPYEQGLAFAAGIQQLAQDFQDIHVVLKEKVPRVFQRSISNTDGPRLVALYESMERHPRMTMLQSHEDPLGPLASAGAVVSFPFTSMSFVALTRGIPGVWFDPLGRFRDSPYAEHPGLVFHEYAGLRAWIARLLDKGPADWSCPLPPGHPDMDPYCDGKAHERFRRLLAPGKATDVM